MAETTQDAAQKSAAETEDNQPDNNSVKEKKKLSMSSIVLIAFGLGIVAGLFFGETVAWMGVIGDAFIKLLQMTIIPFIIVSLITSLGRLSFEQAKSLGANVGKLMLIIWGLGLLAIYTIKFTFPEWQAGAFFSLTVLEDPQKVNLLDLYIPANPFYSLSNSYIPAIVVFCVATGIALISIDNKESLLTPLDLLGSAFNKVTAAIVKLMPLGIFAMTAATAGTMELAEFQRLQVYFIGHIVMTIILTFFVLPAVVAIITPFKYQDIVGIAKDAMITAFAAGNIFIILPILIERTKELYAKYDIASKDTDNYANIIIPVVFSFPNLGKLLTVVFVLFAAWFSGQDVDLITYLPMAFNGLISLFGSVYLTIPMLLDDLELPTDLFQLYVVSSLFTSRFTSLLAAMNIFILAVGGVAMLAGIAKISKAKLIFYSVLTPIVFGASIGVSAIFLSGIVNTEYKMDSVVANMKSSQVLPEIVSKYNWLPVPTDQVTEKDKPRSLADIKTSKVLRIGYNPTQVPFSYFNAKQELVGFDIDLVNRLAQELEVSLEFIPFMNIDVEKAMNQGKVDIAISGLQMTSERIQHYAFTNPVLNLHYSLVVKDHRVDEFESREVIQKQDVIRIATVGEYEIQRELKQRYPNLKFEVIDSDNQFFTDKTDKWDGLLISLEAGKAWSMLHPEYTTLFNSKELKSYPSAYAVAKHNYELLNFMNAWLALQKSSGELDKHYNYWILGENAVPKTPRWSIIKDVLGWVE
ncbi:cation:dicarboxylase symporter family transporter [Catenovulum sp. SM1970]|uniref:cation:dicarboxylate symporter family transporter n=1 Tax=Marinifaba aquimaris TaxID=2741323 RepID=UPI001574E7B2|nr:cation:dicarboxylase symporter family transporter [Marinifaba aquimaris]NTS77651.1 cation:dicarboxylase symporter family transporter [Marinifaba aquimaris]